MVDGKTLGHFNRVEILPEESKRYKTVRLQTLEDGALTASLTVKLKYISPEFKKWLEEQTVQEDHEWTRNWITQIAPGIDKSFKDWIAGFEDRYSEETLIVMEKAWGKAKGVQINNT